MTTSTDKYSISSSSLESSEGLKMSNQVVRLRDLKSYCADPKSEASLVSTVEGGHGTLSVAFMKKLFAEHSVYDEAEQLQYCAAEVQGQMKELVQTLQQQPSAAAFQMVFHLCSSFE